MLKLSKTNLYFDETSSNNLSDIRTKCRQLKNEGKLDFVVIDYLQLITTKNNRGSRQEEVSQISRSLKTLARDLEVPVLALSQLSRSIEGREDKRPMLADLRESGSIEQDADIIMFLYREGYYNRSGENVSNLTELIIAKNRGGVTGTLNFLFQGEYQLFTSYVGN